VRLLCRDAYIGYLDQADDLQLLEVVAHPGGMLPEGLAQVGQGGRGGHQAAQDIQPTGVRKQLDLLVGRDVLNLAHLGGSTCKEELNGNRLKSALRTESIGYSRSSLPV
jgi:hypothetical protein